MSIEGVSPELVRVSNQERERAAALLQDALDQGMITIDEFGERSAIAAAARTRGELGTVLADLPTAHPVTPARPVERPLELSAGMGDMRQVGQWIVPSHINARCSMGNVKIDFMQAICEQREVWLDAQCGWGNIKVIVPRGWTVLVGEMSVGSGNFSNRTEPGSPGYPVLHLSGRVSAGNIKIRHGRR
ncbi:DUF1707 domain-containing protein [Kutzneria viridogrisea]|uniref:DUF1707 domain-containing protein n=2 Tax=Kutzneria TaxID=43356 RepID=W5VYZ1_9PSEU|nr:DUF1707 domain-containing protein [Kutzneria albida]AHH93792.1 hypothetical protein KALB_415 [Kutzneria albida DSM 43870]MBA8931203.1 hypothetical protein [Kutzneria viridogrisea]